MKYFSFSLALALLLFSPVAVSAAQFEGAEEYTLSSERVVEDNLYSAGTNVIIAGSVNGDLFAAGSNVTITGSVSNDAVLAGGNVQVLGRTGDDLRVAGGTVIIGEDVGGEVLAAGGMLTVSNAADIGGKAYLTGGLITVSGTFNGDVLIDGDEVRFDGVINGNAVIKAQTTLEIGDNAVVTGVLKYEAPDVVNIPASAQIGSVDFTKITVGDRTPDSDMISGSFEDFFKGFSVAFKVMRLLMLVTTVLIFFFVFKSKSQEITEEGIKEFGWSLLRGFVLFIIAPIAVLVLLVTVIGSSIGLIIGASYILMLLLAKIFGAMLLGALIFKLFKSKKDKKETLTWPAALTGAIVFWLLGLVPVIGWIARAVFMLTALGTILYLWYKQVWMKR